LTRATVNTEATIRQAAPGQARAASQAGMRRVDAAPLAGPDEQLS
jgi:hypothetical protein